MTQDPVVIPIEVTSEMLERAKAKSEEMGQLRNSITKGAGNIAGFIGEEAVKVFLGDEAVISNTRNYDILFRGKKIDVKTKRRKAAPKDDYDCSVAAYNPTQKCDIYAFVSVNYDLKTAYVCGWMTPDDYYANCEAMEQGQKDSNIVDGKQYEFHADCYNMKYCNLKRMSELKKLGETEPEIKEAA